MNPPANADNQPGDPDKAARAMLVALNANSPPLRLLLGSDAWAGAQAKLARLHADFDAWRDITLDTNFDRAGEP